MDVVGFLLLAGGVVFAVTAAFLGTMRFSKNPMIDPKLKGESGKSVWMGVVFSLLCFMFWHAWESSELLQGLADFRRLGQLRRLQ